MGCCRHFGRIDPFHFPSAVSSTVLKHDIEDNFENSLNSLKLIFNSLSTMVAKAAHESRNDSTRSSSYAMIHGKKIFIEVDGKGPFMVMTHGLGASSNVFKPLTEVFSRDYTVVRFDWPGLGMTGLAPEHPPLSVPGFLKDLEGVMDYLKIESSILVGHSLGGIISIHFAAKYPARVGGLAVIGAGRTRAVDGKGRDNTLHLAKITRQVGVWARVDDALSLNIPSSSPALARALLRQVTATMKPEGYVQVCEALTDKSHIDPEYSQITCSTCVVGGVHDQIAPVEVTHELYNLISQSGRTPHLCMLKTCRLLRMSMESLWLSERCWQAGASGV